MTLDNYSLLNPVNFRFGVEDAPYLNFYVQSVDLPSISLPTSLTENPFVTVPLPGDHIDFEPLVVTFIVDENLNGYLEVYRWLRGLGFPESYEEYEELVVAENYTSRWQETTSDINVTTMTGSRNGNISFNFIDAFPINLTAPRVSTTLTGSPIVTCQATFSYTYFDVKSIR